MMLRSLSSSIAVVAIILLGGGLSPARSEWQRGAPDNDKQGHLNVGGVDRTYLLHIPESLPESGPVPLVLVFHGGGGHAANMPNFTHFDRLADQEKFLVAYPESFNKSWSDTRGLSPADDVGFIRALITELQRTYHADPRRTYAAGISNGGFFSNRLACDLTGDFAAIAAVAATMPDTLPPLCKPSAPISVMFMHGTKDPLVRIDGGPLMSNRGVAVSLARAVEFWRKWDGLSAEPAVENLPEQTQDGTSVRREVYAGGKQGTEVVVYVITGGGHTWPQGPQYLPAFLVGKASRNLDGTQVIWEFFKKHSR
ncbi:MAG: extracellular catalytic domain type 1 short-chain-length polyhydroxyalkanoate depolymerase [Terriglobales bacterium]